MLSLLVLALCQEPTGQTLTETSLVDHDYSFQLEVAGSNWKLEGEAAAARRHENALALATIPGTSGIAIVSVAQLPETQLDSFAQQTLSASKTADSKEVSRRLLDLNGHEAIECVIAGKTANRELLMVHLFTRRGSYHFHVFAAGLTEDTPRAELETLVAAFTPLEQEPRPRNSARSAPTASGDGWMVQDDVYTNITHGARLRPAQGFQIAAEPELAKRFPAALGNDFVGLIAADGSVMASIGVVDSMLGDSDGNIELEDYLPGVTLERSKTTPLPVSVQVSGAPLFFHAVGAAGVFVSDAYLALHFHDGRFWRFTAWTSEAGREVPDLQTLFAGFEFLDNEAVANAAARLPKVEDRQEVVHKNTTLRHGVFRDFDHRISWTAPPGAWKFTTGTAAAAIDSMIDLYFEAVGGELKGSLSCYRSRTRDAAAFHNTVVSAWTSHFDIEASETKERIVGNVRLRESALLFEDATPPMEYRLITGLGAAGCAVLQVYAPPSAFARSAARFDAIVAGLAFHNDSFKPWSHTETRFENARLGFGFDLPNAEWQVDVVTPEPLQSSGCTVTLSSDDGRTQIQIVALNASTSTTGPFNDPLAAKQALMGGMNLGNGEPVERTTIETTFRSVPATRIDQQGDGSVREAAFFVRNNTAFSIVLNTRDSGLRLEDVEQSLFWID